MSKKLDLTKFHKAEDELAKLRLLRDEAAKKAIEAEGNLMESNKEFVSNLDLNHFHIWLKAAIEGRETKRRKA